MYTTVSEHYCHDTIQLNDHFIKWSSWTDHAWIWHCWLDKIIRLICLALKLSLADTGLVKQESLSSKFMLIRYQCEIVAQPTAKKVKVRFFWKKRAEIWYKCSPGGPELGSWCASVHTWDKFAKFKMASSDHFVHLQHAFLGIFDL